MFSLEVHVVQNASARIHGVVRQFFIRNVRVNDKVDIDHSIARNRFAVGSIASVGHLASAEYNFAAKDHVNRLGVQFFENKNALSQD